MRYSHKTPSEMRSDMIDWVNENSKKFNKYAMFTLRKWGKTVANWLNDMRSKNTPGDEIAIYFLNNMYLRHVFVKTSKLFWTMVSHTWSDNETSVQPKYELILLYLGHGRYGKYISVVTPESDMLTLEDLSTNRATAPTINPAICVNNKKSGTPAMPRSDNPTINKPFNKKGKNNKQPKQQCVNSDPTPGKQVTRNKRCINYTDLNLGIDSNDDSSPPRKCKQSKAVALCKPSQTIIAARNQ